MLGDGDRATRGEGEGEVAGREGPAAGRGGAGRAGGGRAGGVFFICSLGLAPEAEQNKDDVSFFFKRIQLICANTGNQAGDK